MSWVDKKVNWKILSCWDRSIAQEANRNKYLWWSQFMTSSKSCQCLFVGIGIWIVFVCVFFSFVVWLLSLCCFPFVFLLSIHRFIVVECSQQVKELTALITLWLKSYQYGWFRYIVGFFRLMYNNAIINQAHFLSSITVGFNMLWCDFRKPSKIHHWSYPTITPRYFGRLHCVMCWQRGRFLTSAWISCGE